MPLKYIINIQAARAFKHVSSWLITYPASHTKTGKYKIIQERL